MKITKAKLVDTLKDLLAWIFAALFGGFFIGLVFLGFVSALMHIKVGCK
jgi:hypothetical protein